MKKVVLLYGIFTEKIATLPECNPNDDRNWMGWTKKQLLERGYQAVCPIIPKVWEAPYGEWKKALYTPRGFLYNSLGFLGVNFK